MPTSLWLIRHGETDWNAAGRFQGHTDVPLNAVGRSQAALLAERLLGDHLRRPFAAILSSDLSRAAQTAQTVGARLGLPVEQRPGLRERHYGVLSALTPAEMELRYPESFERWRARDPDYVVPEGESLRQFSARVLGELEAIAQLHRSQQVLIVAHGGVLDCAWRAATGMALDAKRTHALRNVSINRLLLDQAGALSVEAWGDVAHLDTGSLDD